MSRRLLSEREVQWLNQLIHECQRECQPFIEFLARASLIFPASYILHPDGSVTPEQHPKFLEIERELDTAIDIIYQKYEAKIAERFPGFKVDKKTPLGRPPS